MLRQIRKPIRPAFYVVARFIFISDKGDFLLLRPFFSLFKLFPSRGNKVNPKRKLRGLERRGEDLVVCFSTNFLRLPDRIGKDPRAFLARMTRVEYPTGWGGGEEEKKKKEGKRGLIDVDVTVTRAAASRFSSSLFVDRATFWKKEKMRNETANVQTRDDTLRRKRPVKAPTGGI